MSLDAKVNEAFKLDFSATMQLAIQQRASLFRAYVTEKACSGEAVSAADIVGELEAEEIEGRARSNADMAPVIDRRWLVFPNRKRIGGYIDTEDRLRAMTDPASQFVQTAASGMNRAVDRVILGATQDRKVGRGGLLGAVVEGKRPGAAGVTLPSDYVTAHGSTGLTQAKLEAAMERLLSDNNDLDGVMPVMAITPKQHTELLQIASSGTSGFNILAQQELKEGRLRNHMGFRFIITNLLPVNAAGKRLCPIWVPSNVVLGVWEEINTYVAPDPSAEGTPRWSLRMRMDCTRIEDKGVHVIECQE